MDVKKFQSFLYLRLILSAEGIGPYLVRTLLAKFSSAENIFEAGFHELSSVEGIGKRKAKNILSAKSRKDEIREKLEKELQALEKINAKIIFFTDEDYPALLKKIYDPPLILYSKGKFSENDKYSVAIVGTRMPTHYGKKMTEKISSDLSSQGITIISGMARGIDSIAHRAALKNGTRTIAVIGSGLDIVYPPENNLLFEEIANNGVIISEYEVGVKPDAQNFPKRNRIISGLSLGVAVMETGLTGGALQTAAFALDQNREVFALPGNVGTRQSEGTNRLIKRGEAKLIETAEDIIEELEIKLMPKIGKNIPKPDISLNMFEEKILSFLSDKPIQIDKLSEISSFTIPDCLAHLLSLEFKGLVKQAPGKMFYLA